MPHYHVLDCYGEAVGELIAPMNATVGGLSAVCKKMFPLAAHPLFVIPFDPEQQRPAIDVTDIEVRKGRVHSVSHRN